MDFYNLATCYLTKYDEKKVQLEFIDAELNAGCSICGTICKHSKHLIRLKKDSVFVRHELSTLKFAYDIFYTEYIKKILKPHLNDDVINTILSFH